MNIQEILWNLHKDSKNQREYDFKTSQPVVNLENKLKTTIKGNVEKYKQMAKDGNLSTTIYQTSGDDCKYLWQAIKNVTGTDHGYGTYKGLRFNYYEQTVMGLGKQCDVDISWEPQCAICDD